MPSRGFLLVNETVTLGGGSMFLVPGALMKLVATDAFRRQLYFTNQYDEAVTALAGLDIVWARTKRAVPWKFLVHMIRVERYDSALATDNPQWKLMADCGLTDFFGVRIIATNANAFRLLRPGGTVPRWRPNLERLIHWTDRFVFAGNVLTPRAGARGEHDADTGEADRTVDD